MIVIVLTDIYSGNVCRSHCSDIYSLRGCVQLLVSTSQKPGEQWCMVKKILYIFMFQRDQAMSDFYDAMSLDSLSSSHPIALAVNDPNEIESLFDGVSYRKVSVCMFSSKSKDKP